MEGGIINEVITKVGTAIHGWFSGFLGIHWIPEIWFWYWWLFVLGMVCGMIIFFFGWSKIVRIIASMAFLFGAIFTAGGWYMKRRLDQREADKPKPKPPPKPPEQDGGATWNPFGKW
jgi:hypothetical protein